MLVDARKELFSLVEVRGQKFLFTDCRVDRNTVPQGMYVYEVRASDEGYEPCEISEHIWVNHYGTLISKKPIEKWDDEYQGRRFLYLGFNEKPEYYENEEGEITDSATDENGEDNNPHYIPKESEWLLYDDGLHIENI